jgi:cell division protein FtsL
MIEGLIDISRMWPIFLFMVSVAFLFFRVKKLEEYKIEIEGDIKTISYKISDVREEMHKNHLEVSKTLSKIEGKIGVYEQCHENAMT